jgi:CMP-N-acetylneuraminic acid synthetase
VFESVIVSTDSEDIANIARYYGAEVPFLRPAAFAGDTSPDIEWLEHALDTLLEVGRTWDAFALLRPTSPFRTADMIQRAWASFAGESDVDSLRAVEPCTQHPGKMWIIQGLRMEPLLPFELVTPKSAATSDAREGSQPWHSTPYQALPPVYVQNASMEIAWTRVVLEDRTIAGKVLLPFVTKGHEGFDINDPYDWMVAERLLAEGKVSLPPVLQPPFDK